MAADAQSLSVGTTTTVSSASLAATWTTSATSGVVTTSDTGVGGVNEGADTGVERGDDGVILRRFGALSPSPPTVSSSLPRLSSQGLFVVVSTEVVGAAARSLPLTIDGVGAAAAAGEGGTDVDEDGKEGGGASRG